ncbi:MAG: excinuclease ABC subunit UvrA, partial [Chlamydiota bacterium]
ETFLQFQEKMTKQGFLRIRLNGAFFELEDTNIPWDRKKKNALFLVIDRLILAVDSRKRLNEAIEQALKISQDKVTLATETEDFSFNLSHTVQSTGKSYPPLTAHTFSFNTEIGMCPECLGLGFQYGASHLLTEKLSTLTPLDLIFLLCKENLSRSSRKILSKTLSALGIDPDTSLSKLSREELLLFFEGEPTSFEKRPSFFTWKGLSLVLSQYAKSYHGNIRSILGTLLEQKTCFSCEGTRLSLLARNVRIEGSSIADLVKKEIGSLVSFLNSISITEEKKALLEESFTQVFSRLDLLQKLGLGYLSLDRSAPTLSGGETQRIRLSRQLGSGLTGCLYVLDEPTIGLHPFDNHLLNQALLHLKNLGNTLVLVEHDPLTMQIADYILDFGKGAGKHGGQILAKGTFDEILNDPNSLTGAYLSGRKSIPLPKKRRTSEEKIVIENIRVHNLKNVSTSIPIRVLSCLTGVSGSGKSTLLLDVLRPQAEKAALAKRRRNLKEELSIQGLDAFDKVIVLDQNPIGTTSRADISTYTELLTPIRHLYSSLPEAKVRGLQPKHFSYNHRKGMCSTCQGLGVRTISLQFLPSVKVECESCKGYRLNPLALQVTFKEKHFGELLKFSIEQARVFFSALPKIVKILDTLIAVGLPYLTLGQEITSLSGGESQRLRLSCELAKRSTGKTLYLFDEPSIGLHSIDIEKIIPIFHNLVDKGNTVILIEHHLDLIAQCDHIIDIGPGAGPEGGSIIAEGTPEEVAKNPVSKTASFLKEHLKSLKRKTN